VRGSTEHVLFCSTPPTEVLDDDLEITVNVFLRGRNVKINGAGSYDVQFTTGDEGLPISCRVEDLEVFNGGSYQIELDNPHSQFEFVRVISRDGALTSSDCLEIDEDYIRVLFDHCQFTGCDDGVDVDSDYNYIVARYTEFSRNTFDGFFTDCAPLEADFFRCTFANNGANGYHDEDDLSKLRFSECTFSENSANAIVLNYNTVTEIEASTFVGVKATPGGRGDGTFDYDEDSNANIGIRMDPSEGDEFGYLSVNRCSFREFAVAIAINPGDDLPESNNRIARTHIADCDVGLTFGEGDPPTTQTRMSADPPPGEFSPYSTTLNRVTIERVFYAGLRFDEAESHRVEVRNSRIASGSDGAISDTAILFAGDEGDTLENLVVVRRSLVCGVTNLAADSNVVRGERVVRSNGAFFCRRASG